MNYDHAYHAGNFADVVKHIVLTRILLHLALKPASFRFIDTHAGAGVYDLASDAAARTGEWHGGVGRLARIDPASAAGELLAPYRGLLRADGQQPFRYPGSPKIAQAFLRANDRALFCETQPAVRAQLAAALGRDTRVKILALDGWTALGAVVPPPERRGLVLVDPPFEAPDEWDRMAAIAGAAFRKWRTGIFMLWYPIKVFAGRDDLVRALRARGVGELLRIEFGVERVDPGGPLARAGLLVLNAPYTLADQMRTVLPALAGVLTRDDVEHWSVDAI